MRYLVAIGGLLAGVAIVVAIWLLLHRAEAPAAPAPVSAAAAQAEPEAELDGEDGSLRVCNQTSNPISIALGYKAASGWQSEGWWVTDPGDCKSVYNGKLDARYYYLYAADDIGGGAWEGKFFLCTRDETFTIFGVEDCLARGYERTGFFEVDTQNRNNWMIQLTDNEVLGAEPVDSPEDGPPLEGDLGPGAGDDQPALDANPDAEGAASQ